MNSPRKKVTMLILLVVGSYALAPLCAGMLNTYDRRGPKIFAVAHHELLYCMGYYMAGHHHHHGKPRVLVGQERSWFYGIKGDLSPQYLERFRRFKGG